MLALNAQLTYITKLMGEVLRLLGLVFFITSVLTWVSYGQDLVQTSLNEYVQTSYGNLQNLELEGVSEDAGHVLSSYDRLSR